MLGALAIPARSPVQGRPTGGRPCSSPVCRASNRPPYGRPTESGRTRPRNLTGHELAAVGRAGITVQRSRKSCGSWSITVDNPPVVNIAVTQTGDPRTTSTAQHDGYVQ
ncbi:hypothetical protein STRIP9103_05429 [Streptomyces ipomoeae 91-03]|uniref:Uncharacterized protein n=1 Tax=Streptomyces ipomoeae 91-03 TaxID=698759 RepID=L1KLG6_9ACTN|nr:hypothetical protein STRIP9103_05429 [Streptomyces ipomoeae 91-03]